MQENDAMLEEVLENFAKLAKIPRPSGHEEKISKYLYDFFKAQGLAVEQDEHMNLIVDKKAAKGFENAPLTILQGHMDMVCVARDGVKYDPLNDPITIIREKDSLHADGTSLGADDGIGVAGIMYVLKHAQNHGPIRALFTVDEEVGMTGAAHLDKKHFSDAKFLINCDSENYDELTIGSAGSVLLDFSKKLQLVPKKEGKTYSICVSGLKGGHSGERIGDGRGNAIRTAAMILHALLKAKIEYDLVEISGGKARNAIADISCFKIHTTADAKAITEVLDKEKNRFMAMYGDVDPDIKIELKETEPTEKTWSKDDRDALIGLILSLHIGVFAMSHLEKRLVETSANLGLLKTEGDRVELCYFPRASINEKLEDFCAMAEMIAKGTGFDVKIGSISPGWPEKKDSKLVKIMTKIFAEQNNKKMKVGSIHAGLECSWHFCKNPAIDMVSIGVTTVDIHSPNEHVILASIPPQIKLILATLEEIARLGK